MTATSVRVDAGAWCAIDAAGALERTGISARFADGRIVGLEPVEHDRLDARDRGLVLVPGFVDLQVNGLDDVDFATASPSQWRAALGRMLRDGTTACCPTFVTAPLEDYDPWLLRLAAARREAESDAPGQARVLGAHLEGPFLGAAPGAHPRGLIRNVDVDWLRARLAAHPGLVRIVTLAPEADPDGAAIALLAGAGVTVALGHTRAAYEDCLVAAERGARLVTHLFNGMNGLHHRDPGVPGAALDDERLSASLIADLVHVHPAVLRLAIARKRSLALVTDAVALDAGRVGETDFAARDGAARLPDGTLAGSGISLLDAVRNVVGLGVPLARAVEMAATVPCAVLGIPDAGRIEVGCRADVVALDRETLAVRGVWQGGTRVA